MQKFTEQTGPRESLTADLLEPKTTIVLKLRSNCETGDMNYI